MSTPSDFEAQLTGHDLSDSLRKLEISLTVAQQRVTRLLQTAFRDAAMPGRFYQMIADRGPDDALAIAEGHGSLPRALWLGRLQGGRLLGRRQRQQAEEALRQLPEALMSWQQLKEARSDVRAARLRMIEEREESRLASLHESRTRPRGETLDRRRTRKT